MNELYMKRCLDLASLGAGSVSPNPLVGALIVYEGKIIGEGWHELFGQAHAEVNAINKVLQTHPDAKRILKKSTLYVNLEPCAHFGKTPPCSDLILAHEIPEVVIGCLDPFSTGAAKGIDKLRKAGVSVQFSKLEKECRYLNRRFFTAIEKKRPYVILKWAQTSNGFMAPSKQESQKSGASLPYWISSKLSRMLVHKWRSQEDALLVGKQTALADDPELTTRLWKGKNPLRLVIDWNLDLPASLKIFNSDAPTYIFNGLKSDKQDHLRWIQLEFRDYLPQYILYQLFLMDVHSLIIEGGREILEKFIAAGLWDEARIITAPSSFEGGLAAPVLPGKLYSEEQIGEDRLQVIQCSDGFQVT